MQSLSPAEVNQIISHNRLIITDFYLRFKAGGQNFITLEETAGYVRKYCQTHNLGKGVESHLQATFSRGRVLVRVKGNLKKVSDMYRLFVTPFGYELVHYHKASSLTMQLAYKGLIKPKF